MAQKAIFLVTLGAVLGCGLMAGIFFTFSAFAMRALAALPPAQGMAAMKAINVAILNPLFFALFFGTTAACLFALIEGLSHRSVPGAAFLWAGSLLYLAGGFGVTTAFNVPLNDALAATSGHESARVWADYLTHWTAWNHVRTVASLAATACFALALSLRAAGP